MNCVPLGHGSGTHQPTSVGRHLLSPLDSGSILFLAISDQTDVGVSGALHAGIGFFGPPNAAPPDPPRGEVCPVTRPGEAGSVSMFCNVHGMI